MTGSDEPRGTIERLTTTEQPAARSHRRGLLPELRDEDRAGEPIVPPPARPSSVAGLYERLVDEVPEDEIELARAVLELIRSRGHLGRLQARAVEQLEPPDLLALRSALTHARWALPAIREAGRPLTSRPPTVAGIADDSPRQPGRAPRRSPTRGAAGTTSPDADACGSRPPGAKAMRALDSLIRRGVFHGAAGRRTL
jgi:hypothetical protein